MAPLVDLDGWKKKKNQNAAASKSKGRKRSATLGDLNVKHSKPKKEAQSSSSNTQEESDEACSDSLPPVALDVDEGGASKGRPALGGSVHSRFWDQFGAYDSDDSDDLTDELTDDWTDDWTCGTGGYWGHNHEECIKSFDWVVDASHVSPYSSPPHEPNALPYNLDDKYRLDPRWFDRSMDVCLEEIRQEFLAMKAQQTPLRPALESGRGD